MSQPTIKTEWAGEGWTESEKAMFTPKFDISLDLAKMGLEQFDLGFENPIVAQLEKRKEEDNFRALGSCQGPERFTLWVEEHDIKAGVDTYFLRRFAKTSIHELAHCVRSLAYSWNRNLREYAATEGIANSVEAMFDRELFGRKSLEIDLLQRYTSHQLQQMHEEFIEDTTDGNWSTGSHREWFRDTGKGCSIGMWCVGKMVAGGATFPEIMDMTPDCILGVAA